MYRRIVSMFSTLVRIVILAVALFSGLKLPYANAAAEEFKPKPLDIILLIDQSPSMFKLSDPGIIEKNNDGTPKRENGKLVYKVIPVRQLAAQYFVDYLHVDQIPSVENRVGIIYFGGGAKAVAPLTKVITDNDVKHFHDMLETPPEPIPWTDTNAAFEAAYKELFESPRANSDHEHAILFLTDGHPQIAYPWRIEDTTRNDGTLLEGKRSYYLRHKKLMARFREKGVKVYTVIIAKSGYVDFKDKDLQKPEMTDLGLKNFVNLWQQSASVTGGEYFRVGIKGKSLNKADLLPIYHAILAEMLNVSPLRREQGDITSEDQTIPIAVGKCRTLLVTVLKSGKETQVTLKDPSNNVVTPVTPRENYVIYKIKDPAEGSWWLRFRGGKGTSYNVSLDCADITLQARFLSPGSSFQQCKPMPIVAKLVSENGEPVNDAIVGVTVLLPDGSKQSIALDNKGNGIYSKEFEKTQQEGQYRLALEGHQGDRVVKKEKGVSLLRAPYLTIIVPKPNLQMPGGDITVQAGVKVGCGLAKGDKDISDGKAQVSAYLLKEDGTKLGPIPLKDDGKGSDKEAGDAVFTGLFTGVDKGNYTLAAELDVPSLEIKDHAEVHFSVTAAPTVTPTPTPTMTPTPTPSRAGHWIGNNKVAIRASSDGHLPLHFDSSSLKDGQVVRVKLSGMPKGITLKTDEIKIPPGKKDVEKLVTVAVSKDAGPAKGKGKKTCKGTLILTYPDGTVTSDPVEITVLPPPTSPWVYILTLLGLLVVGGGAVVVYMVVKGRGELVGTLVYDSAPEGADAADIPLYGSKYDLLLEEAPDYSADISGAGEETGEESEYDYGTGERYEGHLQGGVGESLHVLLTFFARRGKQEARVRVSEANKDVFLNGALLSIGEAQGLRDGDVIETGDYKIRYEYLGSTESEEDTSQWEGSSDEGYGEATGEGEWGEDTDYGVGKDYDADYGDDTDYYEGGYDDYSDI